MKLTRQPFSDEFAGCENRASRSGLRVSVIVLSLGLLTGCEQNTFVPPPPPAVDVGLPVQRTITRYLEATGNTAPIKSVDLVARVQGVLEAIRVETH